MRGGVARVAREPRADREERLDSACHGMQMTLIDIQTQVEQGHGQESRELNCDGRHGLGKQHKMQVVTTQHRLQQTPQENPPTKSSAPPKSHGVVIRHHAAWWRHPLPTSMVWLSCQCMASIL